MTRSERPTVVLTVMIIAAIYVVMLIGLTRSRYFIGAAALDRAARHPEILVNRMTPVVESGLPLCAVPEAIIEDPHECVRATRTLRRLLGLRLE